MVRDRRSLRLKDFDYTQPGPYFVTTVTHGREPLLGSINLGKMELNEFGRIVTSAWGWLGEQYPYLELGASVVMPDHFHAILMIGDHPRSGASRRAAAEKEYKIKPLGQLIGAFKTASAKRINLARGTPGLRVWQRGFHERIIRDDDEMDRIHRYIEANPANW